MSEDEVLDATYYARRDEAVATAARLIWLAKLEYGDDWPLMHPLITLLMTETKLQARREGTPTAAWFWTCCEAVAVTLHLDTRSTRSH